MLSVSWRSELVEMGTSNGAIFLAGALGAYLRIVSSVEYGSAAS
jgi:hypothetical protein